MINPRTKKRAVIITVFTLGISIFVLLGYFIFSEEATCIDGKQNQNEKGIDCGGVCSPCSNFSETQPISVVKSEFVFGGNDKFDALVKIANPNSSVGSPRFDYKVILKDGSGNSIDEKNGSSFILPAETKNIAILGFSVPREVIPVSLEFQITSTEWKDFTDFQKPFFSVSNKRFNLRNDIVGGESNALVKNESLFDFNSVKLNIILRNGSGDLVGVNTTQLNTIRSGEERDASLLWPYQIPGEVAGIEVDVEVDTYNTNNFVKTYVR